MRERTTSVYGNTDIRTWRYKKNPNIRWWQFWKRRTYLVYPVDRPTFQMRGFTRQSAKRFCIHEHTRDFWMVRLTRWPR